MYTTKQAIAILENISAAQGEAIHRVIETLSQADDVGGERHWSRRELEAILAGLFTAYGQGIQAIWKALGLGERE
jgi:hypothetical protein